MSEEKIVPGEEVIEDETIDWKEYTSDIFKILLKYPSDFNLIEDNTSGVIDRAFEIKKDNSGLQVILNPIITGGGCGMADDFTFSGRFYDVVNKINISEKNIMIDNKPFKILYKVLPAGYCNDYISEKCTKNTRVSAYLESGEGVVFGCGDFMINKDKYLINFGGEFNTVDTNEALGIFEEILSTFRFLE